MYILAAIVLLFFFLLDPYLTSNNFWPLLPLVPLHPLRRPSLWRFPVRDEDSPSVRPFVVGLSEEEGGEGNESREAIDWLSLMKEGAR